MGQVAQSTLATLVLSHSTCSVKEPVDSLDHAPFKLVCQAVWVNDLALVVAYA